jgi:hypothetical protein
MLEQLQEFPKNITPKTLYWPIGGLVSSTAAPQCFALKNILNCHIISLLDEDERTNRIRPCLVLKIFRISVL